MKRVAFNIIVSVFAVIYVAVIAFGNISYEKLHVATVPGSYGETFADEKKLEKDNVPDSIKNALDFRYETFEHNDTDLGTISIEKYNGISSELTLPRTIGGVEVTRIGENFFKDLKANSVYIPSTINEIAAEPVKSIKLVCDKDGVFYQDNKDSEDWNLEEAYDSTIYDTEGADIPFFYNDNGAAIELVEYTGDDNVIAIPSHIDGKPVTTVSFDMVKRFKLVVIPETVTSITGKVVFTKVSEIFAVEIIFSILAILIVLVAVNIILPRYAKDKTEYLLSAPQMVLSLVFLVIQLGMCVKFIYFSNITSLVALIASLCVLFIYLVLVLTANRGREHAKNVSDTVKEETANIRNLQAMVKGLGNGVTDPEIKKHVDRVVDAIRYTSARSRNDELEKQVEEEINILKLAIASNEKKQVIASCQKITGMMESR